MVKIVIRYDGDDESKEVKIIKKKIKGVINSKYDIELEEY